MPAIPRSADLGTARPEACMTISFRQSLISSFSFFASRLSPFDSVHSLLQKVSEHLVELSGTLVFKLFNALFGQGYSAFSDGTVEQRSQDLS